MEFSTWSTNHHNMEHRHPGHGIDDNAKIQKQVRHMGCQKVPSHAVSRSEARKVLLGADQYSQKSIVVVITYFLINSFVKL